MSTEPASMRARGRELCLLALCHLESYGADEREEALELLWANPPGETVEGVRELWTDEAARGFARRLAGRLLAHWDQVDAGIEAASQRWRLERMDRIERNLLRVAACELAHEPETPRAVVIAEAVRLAERYGGERSARFVNGLVETLARTLRDAEQEHG